MIKNLLQAIFLLSVFTGSAALAQADLTAISGTVTDATGAVVSAASVDVEAVETGIHYKTQTNNDGIYRVANLHVGFYRVTISKDGFSSTKTQRFEQLAGITRTLDAHLLAAGSATTVTVTAPEMDRSTATFGGTIAPEQVSKVPLNGRAWTGLLLLVPGAVDTGNNPGTQGDVRYAGGGVDDANYKLDGNDMTGIQDQGSLRGNERLQLSTEAIKEFNVPVATYTAEDGGSAGAQINIVSKTGTNELHGSAFEYIRNNAFDARSPFDPKGTVQPPFHLNQFGGSLGGPITKNKTFFFMTYEGLRQSLAMTKTGYVPSVLYRQKLAAQQPSLAFFMNAFPMGTAPTKDANVDYWTGAASTPQQEDSGLIRVDHTFGPRDSAYVRYNIDKEYTASPSALGYSTVMNNRLQNGEVDYTHLFSSTLLNDARFGINRVYLPIGETTGLTDGLSTGNYFTGIDGNNNKISAATTFNYRDDVTRTHGRQTLKAGIYIRRVQMNMYFSRIGTASYSNTATLHTPGAALLANQMQQFAVTAMWPMAGMRKTQYFGYLQDEWKLTPTLTINAGVRYSFFQPFTEAHGRSLDFDLTECGGYCAPGGYFTHPNYNDFDPRVSVAWSPSALSGNTVIRAGYGMYHGETQFGDQDGSAQNTVANTTLTSTTAQPLSYPVAPSMIPTSGPAPSPLSVPLHHPDSYVQNWTLSVQQALPAHILGTISYVGAKGTHLYSQSAVNLYEPGTQIRPLAPQFNSQIKVKATEGASTYNALQVNVTRQLFSGLFFAANYSWSHSLNNGGAGAGEADMPENVACPRCDWATSDASVTNVYNVSSVYQFPFGKGRRFSSGNRVVDNAIGGWEISNLLSGRSGVPLNITMNRATSALLDGNTGSQRPDRVVGQPIYASHRGPGGWLNPAAFSTPANGTWGNLGRNAAVGPGIWQDDVALDKDFHTSEKTRFNFRAEAFNVFNRAQYGQPGTTWGTSAFGQITSLVNSGGLVGTGTPRVMQFAGRFSF